MFNTEMSYTYSWMNMHTKNNIEDKCILSHFFKLQKLSPILPLPLIQCPLHTYTASFYYLLNNTTCFSSEDYLYMNTPNIIIFCQEGLSFFVSIWCVYQCVIKFSFLDNGKSLLLCKFGHCRSLFILWMLFKW